MATGTTVTRGTSPDIFTGDAVGVLQDGIAPGADDMVLVDLHSPTIDEVGPVGIPGLAPTGSRCSPLR